MKYLILLVLSLFCLSSFSDHKKDPVSEEEKARYEELKNKFSMTEEEIEEYKTLKKKVYNEMARVGEHLNEYMRKELIFFEAEKGNQAFQDHLAFTFMRSHFSEFLDKPPYLIKLSDKIPDCTKEGLENKECLKPPHLAIYWAKRAVWGGKCLKSASFKMYLLMNNYVIPKTDIRGHESLFFIFRYIAAYFTDQYEHVFYLKDLDRFKEDAKKRLKEGSLSKSDYEFRYVNQHEKEKKNIKEYSRKFMEEARKPLSKKEQEIAHKMISDLIQKWSKKYGKENIYKCKDRSYILDISFDKAFLEEHYPHFD